MELLKNLELVNVEYENEGQKAILTFLDEERGEVRTVNFNKQVYADGKYINDQTKEQKVESWCAEYFDTSFDKLQKAIGTRHDIYAYDNFNLRSLSTATQSGSDSLMMAALTSQR